MKMASSSTDEVCFFKCTITSKELLTAGPARIKTVINCSKRRGDGLHVLLDWLESIRCHKTCVSTYTSEHHMRRFEAAKKKPSSSVEDPSPKKLKRSQVSSFEFKKNCLFCGEMCIPLAPDCHNPDRWRRVAQCRTVDNFKKNILDVCDLRNDHVADSVCIRVSGAVADLHAADAQYHNNCYKTFVSARSIKAAVIKSAATSHNKNIDNAFEDVQAYMGRDMTQVWNSVELHKVYLDSNEQHLTRR